MANLGHSAYLQNFLFGSLLEEELICMWTGLFSALPFSVFLSVQSNEGGGLM